MTFEQSVLNCISLAAVAVLAAMGVVVCVSEFHLSAIRQSLQDFRRLPWYAQLFLVAFVSHFVVYGSVKTNQTDSAGGDVTNAPPMMLMIPRPPTMVMHGGGPVLLPIAKRFVLASQPPSPFIGTEVATNVALTVRDDIRVFDLVLSLAASFSNNVEIAFGTDLNTNGVLDRSERRFAVGWDCGAWTCSDERSDSVVHAIRDPGDRTLVWHLSLDSRRRPRPQGLVATDDAAPVFGPVASPGMFDPAWDLARIAVRGDGDILGSASFTLSRTGLSVIVR